MSSEILDVNTIVSLLERITNGINKQNSTLERIELILEEKQNKTQEAKECRELMQAICKHYKDTQPSIDVQEGSTLQVFRFRNGICQIKNIRNTRFDTRKLNKWIRKLEDHLFIKKNSDQYYQVLSTGQSWWDVEE